MSLRARSAATLTRRARRATRRWRNLVASQKKNLRRTTSQDLTIWSRLLPQTSPSRLPARAPLLSRDARSHRPAVERSASVNLRVVARRIVPAVHLAGTRHRGKSRQPGSIQGLPSDHEPLRRRRPVVRQPASRLADGLSSGQARAPRRRAQRQARAPDWPADRAPEDGSRQSRTRPQRGCPCQRAGCE